MRKYIVVGLLVGISFTVPYLALGSVLRVTIGASQAYLLWQTSPPIFGDSTRWGGVGLELIYGSISVGASVTITDFETLTITQHPAFSFGASIAIFKISSSRLFLGTSLMIQPYYNVTTASASIGFGWSPSPFVDFYTSIGIQKTLPTSTYQGTCVNWGIGTEFSWPLF